MKKLRDENKKSRPKGKISKKKKNRSRVKSTPPCPDTDLIRKLKRKISKMKKHPRNSRSRVKNRSR